MDHQWHWLDMSSVQTLIAGYANPLLLVDSADFDGTNDYMTTSAGLTGAADSKTGTMSLWIRIDGGDGTFRTFLTDNVSVGGPGGASTRVSVGIRDTNVLQVTARAATGTTNLDIRSVTAYTASATWLHFMASWNLAIAGSSRLYVNDVSDLSEITYTDTNIDYTVADWSVGAICDGTSKLDGCLAELYFSPGQYMDFSLVSNRRKFISASGKPVWLGADGSAPTGTAPLVYQRVADGAAVATFATNLGTGGNFSITGTLTSGSTSPSD